MRKHISESDVALFVSGDLGLGGQFMVRMHVNGCERCRRVLEAYRHDRAQIRKVVDELPEGLDWSRLASEMTANIRVGLAAGECVTPRTRKTAAWGWRPAAVIAGLTVVLVGSWWLNMPPAQTQELGRAMHAIWNAGGNNAGMTIHRGMDREERGLVVEATASGIELRENGSSLGVSQGEARPLTVSLNVQGSASAHYVDADTGQISITSVYTQ